MSFLASMWLHPMFSATSIAMILLFLTGIHRRVVSPSIFVQRTREVLFDFRSVKIDSIMTTSFTHFKARTLFLIIENSR